jgi:hypothetical protein
MPYADDAHAASYRSKILARLGGTLSQAFINAWHLDTLGFFGLLNFFGPSSEWGVAPPQPPIPDEEGMAPPSIVGHHRLPTVGPMVHLSRAPLRPHTPQAGNWEPPAITLRRR